MSGNSKVLGICLAKMQDRVRTEYLSAINRSAHMRGWKTVAYNSFRDFRKNDISLQGAKSIYEVINYDDVDVVVVFPESINNSEVADNLIENAQAAGKPVISIGPEKKGCYSIVRDFEQGFKSMLNHVINEHNARDLYFVSGFKNDDEKSVNFLNVYRETLKENGIEFNDKKICYGNYKDEVIGEAIDKVLSGSSIPRAFICIDDKTAIAVCEKMAEYDLKSPDDIIVTGFGGIPSAYYYHPSITSCSDDPEEFAELVIQAAMDAMDGREPGVYRDQFKPRIRRSCGCDMRSYMSAGRRSYDLEAAKAAGLYVPGRDANAVAGDAEAGAQATADENAEAAGLKVIDYGINTHRITSQETARVPEDERIEDDTVYIPNVAYIDRKDSSLIEKIERKDGSLIENNRNEISRGENSQVENDRNETYPGKDEAYGFNVTRKFGDDKLYSSLQHVDTQGELSKTPHPSPAATPSPRGEGLGATQADSTDTPGSNITRATGNREAASSNIAPIIYDRSGQTKPVDIETAVKRANEVADDKRCAGLHGEKRFRSSNHVAYIYKELDEIERREDSILAWIDRMLEITELSDICDEISKRIPSGAELFLYTELLESNFDIETFDQKYAGRKRDGSIDKAERHTGDTASAREKFGDLKLTRIISAADANRHSDESMNCITNDGIALKDIAKGYITADPDDRMLILNPVFIGDFVCGFYAIRTSIISEIRSKTKLLNTGLNLIFRFLANQNRQQRMLYNIENSVYVSSMTGLPNLKGSTRWFESFAAVTENHKKPLSISVFAIPRYTYIYENYGLNEIEDAVRLVVDNVRNSCRKSSFIGQFAEGEYIVIDHENEGVDLDEARNMDSWDSDGTTDTGSGIHQATYADEIFASFDRQMQEYNRGSTKEYFLEVNYGTATVEIGWDSTLENLVRMAVSDMYLRRLRQGRTNPVIRGRTFDSEYFTTFELLVDKNLFRYHFQPIIDAATGKIYAYEALMRTGGGISMAPLDVLEIAKNANRLNDIERATLYNVLKIYEDNVDKFGDKKLFINLIPGNFIKDEERAGLIEKYGKYMENVVFEVTEANTVSDDDIDMLRSLNYGGKYASLAIDDYGTGHSNIVNLLRYSPNIIKIDRYLISNIQDDANKQMFVKNTIEFAEANGIKVLAEGVETFDEMKTVIEYGVDYIQGYYTAHPSAEIMQQIPNNIRNEILSESIKSARFNNDNLTYNAKAGETVNLLELALKKYTTINVLGGKVKLVGEPDNVIDMVVKVMDGKKTDLIFENVNLRGVNETTVQLGRDSETALNITGECTLNKDGIYVPAGSRLSVSGDGNLHIITSRNMSFGVGSNSNEPHGDILFDMMGSVRIVANGDKVVGIGGGRCEDSRIRLMNGRFDISAKAIHAVAVGSDSGNTDIYIGRTARCRLKSDGNDSVALGSIGGKAEIVCRGKLEITGDGEKAAGIGSLNGYTKTDLLSNDISVVLHSYCGIGVGSLTGQADIKLEDANVDIYAEGTQINGFGSGEGVANAELSGSKLNVEILAGIPRSFGAQKGDIVLNYGSVTSLHDVSAVIKDGHGQRLKPRYIENGVVFEV